MKSIAISFIALGYFALLAYSRQVNFSVIAFCSTVKLSLNGQLYDMTKEDVTIPLWKTSAEVGDGDITYNYVCDITPETVTHTLASQETTTHNELFNREKTIYELPKLGYPNTKPWERSIGQTELFDETYIPTFVFSGYGNFFVSGAGSNTFSKVVAILKDNVFTFNNIPTSGKNGDEDKFQFKITLPGDGIYHRNELKFRPSSYDPVFFRQILYGDILHAIGNPAHESVTARVYQDDGTGVGLYVLQEDCTTESFIRTAFYGNADGTIQDYEIKPIYDCATGADFNVNDPNYLGAFKNNTFDLKMELLEMTRQIDIMDVNSPEQVTNLDKKWIELDTLLRALAVEYLAGHWDSYWFLSTNFITYHPAAEAEPSYLDGYKFYFIDQDFDQTWGVGMGAQLDPLNFPNKSYKDFVGMDWANLNPGEDFDSTTRVIVDKLIGCGNPTDKNAQCTTKTYFESHLKSIVQHIFNPVSLGGRIDAYKDRLRPEVIWDTQEITRQHTGTLQQFKFTINDFDGNVESGQYLGSRVPWGLKDWTAAKADQVCAEFGFEYDKVALTPETAKNYKPQEISADQEYKPEDGGASGSEFTKPSILISAVVGIMMIAYLFI